MKLPQKTDIGFYPPKADRYQGGREVQTAGVNQYFEDLNRAPNAETCPPLEDWAKRLF